MVQEFQNTDRGFVSYYLLVIHAGQVARTHAGSGIILVQLRELAKRKM